MPKAFDLNELKNRPPREEGPDYDDLTEEQKEQLREQAEDTTLQVQTAFTVIVNTNGSVDLSPELNLPLARNRIATPDDLYAALCIGKKDVESHDTAVRTAQAIHGMATEAQRQMQAANIARDLKL